MSQLKALNIYSQKLMYDRFKKMDGRLDNVYRPNVNTGVNSYK